MSGEDNNHSTQDHAVETTKIKNALGDGPDATAVLNIGQLGQILNIKESTPTMSVRSTPRTVDPALPNSEPPCPPDPKALSDVQLPPAPPMPQMPVDVQLPPTPPTPQMPVDVSPSIETRTGNYASGTVDNGYAQTSFRNGVGESARGRPLDGDHHSELTNIDGGGYTVSSVGYVKLDGQQYNVEVTQFRQDSVTQSTYVGIAPSSDPMNNIVTLSSELNDLSPKMRALADAALSANGKGGTALTYEEAKGILVEGLSSPARPVSKPQEPEVPGARR